MKKTFYFILGLLLLSGCYGGNDTPRINAEGLSGIGSLQIGQTKKEIIKSLSKVKDYSPNISGYGHSDKDTPEVSGCTGDYTILQGEKISLYCTFFRDTLVYFWIGKLGGPEKIQEALSAKYGEGIKYPITDGYREIWRGERVKAIYTHQDDNNPDFRKRRTTELIEFSMTERDINSEIEKYAKRIKEKRDSIRRETLSGIL